MSVFIFIIVLAVLILVHEFGHFIVAKKSGIKVDEFGIGFPPKIFGKKKGETEYTINWIPFGGFVKIVGENPSEKIDPADKKRSLLSKPRPVQAAVIVAGVAFNILFAWILLSAGLMYGLPASVDASPDPAYIRNVSLTVTGVLPGSPAQKAGLQMGDKLVAIATGKDSIQDIYSVEQAQQFIEDNSEGEIGFIYTRGSLEPTTVFATPEEGLVTDKKAVGISMGMVGLLKFPPHLALLNGVEITAKMTRNIAMGLWGFFKESITGKASITQISGPVGIVGLVGEASELGFVYLLSFAALISINLAIINLIPIPALDGGRLLFIIIESIKRSPINPKIATVLNSVGFVLLIILMVVITYNDILKLISG